MLEKLKERVCLENKRIKESGLVVLTWGNVSAFDKESGLVVIKPSGVDTEIMKPEDMVVVDLDGNVVEGTFRPSSDTPTHLYLYRSFPDLGGIVHTHSTFATSFAQSGMHIPPLGTTHADQFYGEVPCSRPLTDEEINTEYEANTGKVIVETFEGLDHNAIPAVLVNQHGVFTWGKTCEKAVEVAITLEEVAKMAMNTVLINPSAKSVGKTLLDKHYLRKHGKNAYYGQK